MRITVNGSKHEVEGPSINYHDILKLSGERDGASVTYRSKPQGDVQRQGIMIRGDTIMLDDGMIFNAANTGNA